MAVSCALPPHSPADLHSLYTLTINIITNQKLSWHVRYLKYKLCLFDSLLSLWDAYFTAKKQSRLNLPHTRRDAHRARSGFMIRPHRFINKYMWLSVFVKRNTHAHANTHSDTVSDYKRAGEENHWFNSARCITKSLLSSVGHFLNTKEVTDLSEWLFSSMKKQPCAIPENWGCNALSCIVIKSWKCEL